MPAQRAIVVGAAYAVTAGVCTQIPLLKTFGFEYAFLFGLLATFTAGPLTIAAIRNGFRTGSSGRRSFVRALLVNLALLGLPLLVMLGAAATARAPGPLACDPAEGVGFFFLLPFVTAIFTSSLGYFCAVHYRRPQLIYWSAFLLSVAYAIGLGYYTPAIFSYNFFYGYFPGITYDELLPLTVTLVLFRILTLVCAGLLVWMAFLIESNCRPDDRTGAKGATLLRALAKSPRVFVSIGATGVMLLVYVYRCELGFETTETHLQRTLRGLIRTDHFAIYYRPESCDSSRIARIAAEHEYLLARLMDIFALGTIDPIASYLYPSNEAKQKLIGAGSTNIAKPWNRQVHVSLPSLEGVLGHELVHVVAGRFGQPVIAANLSTGLVEGLAMAVDETRGERTSHRYAAALRRQGIAPDITSLMSFRGFAVHSSSISYVLAGSFCRYLIDRYGIRRIVQVYGGTDYETVYARPLPALVGEWGGFLDRIQVNGEDTLVVDAFFRRPAVFAKVCPRVAARRNREASEAFARKEYELAASRYRAIYGETGAYESLAGYLASLYRLREYDSLIAPYRTRVATDPRPGRYLSLFVLFGDAFWAKGDTATALELFRRLAAVNANAGLTEQALVRIGALTETESAAYREYLMADVPDSVRLDLASRLVETTHESPLALFLKGRAAQRMEQFDTALTSFGDVDDRRFDPPLKAARLWAAGECLFRLGRYQEAKVPFWESLNHLGTEARQEEVNGWITRCEWMSALRNH